MTKKNEIFFDFESVGRHVILQEGQYLSNYSADKLDFSKGLPKGIFNKKYPGTGATYCEFKAPRPSIVVLPFRKLAWEKSQSYSAYYVGTLPNNKSREPSEIKDWYRKNKSKNPKFSVVADSIGKLVKALQDEGVDPYKNFFLVLDEVELLQMQSGFRKVLPLCFDYFKKFEQKCLVSATLLNFSDKEIDSLQKYTLEVYTEKRDELGIPETREKEPLQIRNFSKNPHWAIANQIVEFFSKESKGHKVKKFFIGLNFLQGITEMVEIFEAASLEDKVSVHVSSDSKEAYFRKYNKKEIVKGILPTEINLTTCINFSAIDINEDVHAVAISTEMMIHHSFSFENLVQFFGRSRVKQKSTNTFALAPGKKLDYKKPSVSMKKRKSDLNGLLKFVNKKIRDDKDCFEIKSTLTETKTGLIYKNIDGNPAVNWLLEDLEKYDQVKVGDYDKKARSLKKKLEKRFEVENQDHLKYKLTFFPETKNQDEKDADTLEKFLDNLDEHYESIMLVNRFLNPDKLQSIRVAAYWYLFGRSFGLTEQDSLVLAKGYSEVTKPFESSAIIVEILRFYIRYRKLYQDLTNSVSKKQSTQRNVTSAQVVNSIEELPNYKFHFPHLFELQNTGVGGAIILKYFLGIRSTGSTKLRFSLKDTNWEKPQMVKKFPSLEKEFNKISSIPKGEGITPFKYDPQNLIDTEFKA
ncbi:hypothetical protein AAGF08_09675 [Algoriphagus sp. SE2]|uniref:hypothetical protein n=1 Tax=Algoriphagus sp. SE2 TaxID=3141536 RepID=UPI0031CD629A